MVNLFAALLILTIWGLAIGLVRPHTFKKVFKSKCSRSYIAKRLGVVALVCLIGIAITAPKTIQSSNTDSKSTVASKATVTTKKITTTQPVAFSTSTVNDATLASGTTTVKTAGVNGVETLTYTLTYTNGKQTSRKLVSTAITTPAVTEIVDKGTYVAPTTAASAAAASDCTNGTYVNSDGNTVCSPEVSATVPAGATAQCVDGSYSFSQHHEGTCSDHGGVAQWLN